MLSNTEILDLMTSQSLVIENFNSDCLRSSSYLARVGTEILSLRDGEEVIDTRNTDTSFLFDKHLLGSEGFILEPKQFYLLSSFERFSLPSFISADLSLLSCYARIGICGNLGSTHVTSTFGAQKESALTFELFNLTDRRIKIYPRVKFFHIRFFSHEKNSSFLYEGIYSGYSIPKPANFSDKPAR